jgi:hypothetical protein
MDLHEFLQNNFLNVKRRRYYLLQLRHFRIRKLLGICRIPDDCIDSKRYPLFMARAVMQGVIESFEQSSTGDKAP